MNENDSGAKRQKMLQDQPGEAALATAPASEAAKDEADVKPLEVEDGDSEDGLVSWYHIVIVLY